MRRSVDYPGLAFSSDRRRDEGVGLSKERHLKFKRTVDSQGAKYHLFKSQGE